MKQSRTITVFLAGLVMVSVMASNALAMGGGDYTNDSAPRSPKAFYDINVQQPEMLRDFLWVIDVAYDNLIAKGVPAHKIKFVASLRGLSVAFVTEDFLANDPVGQEINGHLTSLLSKGVRVEACIISCQWVGVDPEALQEEVVVIDHAFVSSIFYQRRGYALIPIHQLP